MESTPQSSDDRGTPEASQNGQIPAIATSRTSTGSGQPTSGGGQQGQHSSRADHDDRAPPNTPGDTGVRMPWHIEWTPEAFAGGRVLIIDYLKISTDPSDKRHLVVVAQEFSHVQGLQTFYSDPRRAYSSAALRLIHVQNAPWASDFFAAKLNIDLPALKKDPDPNAESAADFSQWVEYTLDSSTRSATKARTFRPQLDAFRNISRMAFYMDYLKAFPADQFPSLASEPRTGVLHLNSPPGAKETDGYEVYPQHVAVYVQRSHGQPGYSVPPPRQGRPPRFSTPPYSFDALPAQTGKRMWNEDDGKIYVESLDNSNVILIVTQSADGKLGNSLFQPRGASEHVWRHLSFYLRKEDASDDDRLAAHCTNMVLSDVFTLTTRHWSEFLEVAAGHVELAGDQFYQDPADDSRAPLIWADQAAWTQINKVLSSHRGLVRQWKTMLFQLYDDIADELVIKWLQNVDAMFSELGKLLQEDVVQPTEAINDQMYKAVAYKDARESLSINQSLWRLSWITFIFLPLTFIVGFFGMNVGTFTDYPSIGWYFVAAAVLMAIVLLAWLSVKLTLARRLKKARIRSDGRRSPGARRGFISFISNLATRPARYRQGSRTWDAVALRPLQRTRTFVDRGSASQRPNDDLVDLEA